MAKKQNKYGAGADLFDLDSRPFELDSSKQGPTRKDMERVKNTPSSAYAGARVGHVIRTVLRTVNRTLDIWTEQNMDTVSRKAGQIASLPLQLGESALVTLYEAAVKPIGKITGLKVTPPKEKEHDNNEDDHDNDLDNESQHGLTQDEIEELLAEIDKDEANQDDDPAGEDEDMIENDDQWMGENDQEGEDYVN